MDPRTQGPALSRSPDSTLADSGPLSGASWPRGDRGAATVAGSGAAAPQVPADELGPGTQVGRYMILSRLGAGAMGVVYAAYDPELDRKVALKLLHPRSGASVDARARLMREAKALARLSHPNVVAVHDVGTYADRVFLAMEFVDGKTLGAWLKDQVRPWRDVVAIMREAGNGLAAAHDAGLIHRDFKPDNVLIAHDGRVRVLDFGLARAAGELTAEEADPAAAAVISSAHSARRDAEQHSDAALMTRTGAIVGTPAYMSPEQHLGRPADARSDQFAFCVTFYQALYGSRPFAGERMSALAFQVLQGKVAAAPPGATVPAWLRKVVLRGLAVDADLRHPGMRALLGALHRERRFARSGWYASAGLAALFGVWLAVGPAAVAEPPCRGGQARLAGIWDADRQSAIEQAFLASRLPYAADSWASLRASLQAYSDEWAGVYNEACEATEVRRAQSPVLLDLRMRCLERRRTELRALTDVLARGDPAAVEQSGDAASHLADLAPCSDADALTAIVAPPSGAQLAEVDRVTAQVAEASALELAGHWGDAEKLAAEATLAAAAADYPPLQAHALRVHAVLQRHLGRPAAAADQLLAAVDAAARGHDDRAAADAWTDLVLIAGAELADAPATAAYTHAASAATRRAGDDPLLRARLDANAAAAQLHLGALDDARARGQAALAIFASDPRADPMQHQRLLCTLALVYKGRGELPAARDALREALAIVRRVSGGDHPGAAVLLTNLGDLALDEHRVDDARQLADEAAAIRRRSLPPSHVQLADTEQLFARIAEEQDDPASAAAHYRSALEIYAASPSASKLRLAALHNNIATLAASDGRYAAALPEFQSALTAFRAGSGPESDYVIVTESNIAEALLALDRPAEALPLQEHVIAALARTADHDPASFAEAAVQLAQILRAIGRPQDAVARLTPAIATLAALPEHAPRLALARYTLARALADLRQDRPEQLRLLLAVEPVLAVDEAHDVVSRRALAELRAWRLASSN